MVGDREERAFEHERIESALRALDKRECLIIRARYLRETPQTLSQIGKRLGVCRERVRQLEVRALKKLEDLV